MRRLYFARKKLIHAMSLDNAAKNLERLAASSAVSACGEARSGAVRKSRVKRASKKQEPNGGGQLCAGLAYLRVGFGERGLNVALTMSSPESPPNWCPWGPGIGGMRDGFRQIFCKDAGDARRDHGPRHPCAAAASAVPEHRIRNRRRSPHRQGSQLDHQPTCG